MTDYAHNARAQENRQRKAVEIEWAARELGYQAADLADEANRKAILREVAKGRGKPPSAVSASLETWRLVWTFMADYERSRAPETVPHNR